MSEKVASLLGWSGVEWREEGRERGWALELRRQGVARAGEGVEGEEEMEGACY